MEISKYRCNGYGSGLTSTDELSLLIRIWDVNKIKWFSMRNSVLSCLSWPFCFTFCLSMPPNLKIKIRITILLLLLSRFAAKPPFLTHKDCLLWLNWLIRVLSSWNRFISYYTHCVLRKQTWYMPLKDHLFRLCIIKRGWYTLIPSKTISVHLLPLLSKCQFRLDDVNTDSLALPCGAFPWALSLLS